MVVFGGLGFVIGYVNQFWISPDLAVLNRLIIFTLYILICLFACLFVSLY